MRLKLFLTLLIVILSFLVFIPFKSASAQYSCTVPGETDPYMACTAINVCSSVSGCGVSVCSTNTDCVPGGNGIVKGYKVLMPGNQTNNSTINSQPVTIGTVQKTDNPYSFGVYLILNTVIPVSVPTLAGYNIGYTLCYNSTTCHNNPPISGNSANVSANSIGSNGYADLWWHYTPIPTPTPTPIPTYTVSCSVFVDLDQDGIKDPNENNYSGSITVSSSGGSVSYPSDGACMVSNLPAGTYTVTFTLPSGYKATYPTPPSYSVTLPCSSPPNGQCDGNNIINLNFGISNSYPWFVCVGADCRIDTGVTDPIPFGPPPITANCGTTTMQSYVSVPGGLSNSPGIVFTGNTTADFNLGQASSQGWLVGSSSDPQIFSAARTNIIRTSYGYLMTSIGQKGVTPIQIKNTNGCGGAPNCAECDLSNCDLSNFSSSGVYTVDQSLVLKNQAYTFPSAKNHVFLINGDLTIQKDLIVPSGSTVTFSVSRDILIDKNLGETNPGRVCNPLTHQYCNLEGYFSADRNFVIQANATDCPSRNDRKLNVAGSIVVNAALGGGAFINERDLCGDNLNCPTFTITERPDFILSAPDFIKYPNYIWREVAP